MSTVNGAYELIVCPWDQFTGHCFSCGSIGMLPICKDSLVIFLYTFPTIPFRWRSQQALRLPSRLHGTACLLAKEVSECDL